jgi:hypothetical protein
MSRTLRSPRSNLAWLILIVTPLILFWRILLAGQVLFWGVPLLQFYPWQQLAVEMWLSGNVPLWNTWVGNGAPLAANMQSAVFYPLNVLYLLLPVERAMGYTALLHVILAGLAMYAWGRAFGLRPLSALVGALAFQLSQFFIARLAFLSITVTFPWIAVWLWRVELFVQRRRWTDSLWLALAIGLGLLAGHAQTAAFGLMVVVAYAALRLWQEASGKWQGSRRFLWSAAGGLLAAIVLGFALAAVQLLPAAELTAQSHRVGGLDYEFAVTHSLYPLRLLTLLAPDLMGHPADGNFWGYDNYWENAAYAGVWALLMAAFALSNLKSPIPRFRPTKWFLGVVILVSLLFALGRFTPFYPALFKWLPGASLFQGPARMLCVYALAMAALAGIGTDELLVGDRLRWSGRLLIAAALAVLLVVAAGSFALNLRAVFVRPVLQFGLTLGACAAYLAFRPSLDSPRFKGWAAALAVMVALDLLVADWRLNPTTDASLYHQPTVAAQVVRSAGDGRLLWFADDESYIKFGKYFAFKTFGPDDAGYWRGVREALLPDTSVIERVATANNFDSLLPGRYSELITRLDKSPLADALRLAGVMDARYIVSPRELPLPVIWHGNEVTVYRNDQATGRAWIVQQAIVIADPLQAMTDAAFDPLRALLIEPGDAAAVPVREFAPGPSSIALRDSPNAVTIRAASAAGGFLVLADTFYPGWQATLDGQPIGILRGNYAFRAIVLPPGEHTVVFRYAPASFRLGAAITLLALAVTVFACLVLSLRQPAI